MQQGPVLALCSSLLLPRASSALPTRSRTDAQPVETRLTPGLAEPIIIMGSLLEVMVEPPVPPTQASQFTRR